MRRINQLGLAIVKRYEGMSRHAYKCPAGYWTIGCYGHRVKPSERFNEPLTDKSMDQLLESDLSEACKAVQRLIKVPVRDNQFSALVSFTFNLGSGCLQRSVLRARLNRSEYKEAGQAFMLYVRASGRVLKGLLNRRHDEMMLFMRES